MEIGVVEKHQRLLSDGGYVNVYAAMDPETVGRQLLVALYAWERDAIGLVEEFLEESQL